MSDWLQVNVSKLSRWRTETIQGTEVKLLSSPYDIPRAVRGFYEKDKNRVVVEFSYLTSDEPLHTLPQNDTTNFIVGKNSGRIFKAEMDVSKILAGNPQQGETAVKLLAEELPRFVAAQMNKAIDSLASNPQHFQRSANYEAAKEAVSENEDKLFEKVPA